MQNQKSVIKFLYCRQGLISAQILKILCFLNLNILVSTTPPDLKFWEELWNIRAHPAQSLERPYTPQKTKVGKTEN